MSQITPAEDIPLRICCPCEKDTCSGETVRVETEQTTEIFVRCAPLRGEAADLEFEGQARRFYNCLPKLLAQGDGQVAHVVLERAFFEDFEPNLDKFRRVRQEAYDFAGVPPERMPAITLLRQPPCHRAQKIELQVYAVVPKSPGSALVQTVYDPATGSTAKILTIAGRRHLYIADVKGIGPSEKPGSFRSQSDRMFSACAKLLAQHGARFTQVLRTWCYLKDIDRDYAEFNLSRNAFFELQGVQRLPASTGIEAGLWPDEALCSMDLYALLDTDGVGIDVMHTPTLNEADQYGSAFSRGMRIDLPEKTVLHISGTASIDDSGATVHTGQAREQIERMLLNVRELLVQQGASFEDVVQIATFLKSGDTYELCQELLRQWGIRHVPNTFVETGVCRPELLCEMEAIAILRKRGANGRPAKADCSGL